MKEIWIQADETFISLYTAWSKTSFDSSTELLVKTPSPYSQKGPTTSPSILKSQIQNQSNLVNMSKDKYRLTGDFFAYLIDLETCNNEIQTQLNLTLSKLERQELEAIRDVNAARDTSKTLTSHLTDLISDYRNAENVHLENLRELGETVLGLREDLGRVTGYAKELEEKLNEKIMNTTNPRSFEKSGEKSRSSLDDNLALQNEILRLRRENVSLKERNQSLEKDLEKSKNDNLVLTEKGEEYKTEIQRAKETEDAFKEQSIAIEKLRDALESGELLEGDERGGLRHKPSQRVLRRLPSKDLRLNRTEEGWEW